MFLQLRFDVSPRDRHVRSPGAWRGCVSRRRDLYDGKETEACVWRAARATLIIPVGPNREGRMKRKHRPVIPKFGRSPTAKPGRARPDGEGAPPAAVKPVVPARVEVVKPHSTSMNSGPRGSE